MTLATLLQVYAVSVYAGLSLLGWLAACESLGLKGNWYAMPPLLLACGLLALSLLG